jgi:hypothetical protein
MYANQGWKKPLFFGSGKLASGLARSGFLSLFFVWFFD